METITKPNKYQAASEQLRQFKELQVEKSQIDAHMKKLKLDLGEFADENPQLFTDDKLEMEYGVIRYATRTKVVTGDRFNVKKAFETAPEYLKFSIPVAPVKSAYDSAEGAKKMKKLHISLEEDRQLVIE